MSMGEIAANHGIHDVRPEELLRSSLSPQSVPGRKSGSRILLIESDLFSSVGGGQSSYRKLIELNPQNTYYYFTKSEELTAARPSNAKPIPFIDTYYRNVGDLPAEMGHFYSDYFECYQLAASVKRHLGSCAFDVVDVPDYKTLLLFMRSVLASHGITVGVTALALHGSISSALRDLWPNSSAPARALAELRLKEHLQYRAADVRYALSETYAGYWHNYTGIASRTLDPLIMVGRIEPTSAPAGGPPDVAFIGRRERRKGPDIFADILWGLERTTYRRAILIGADTGDESGNFSAPVISAVSARRELHIESHQKLTRPELDNLFKGRTVTVLPSRYDQFNLVALEALRLGCPTFISKRAGAADWLIKRYPDLSFLAIDIDCSRSAIGAIRSVLRNYDTHRQTIVETLARGERDGAMNSVNSIYLPQGEIDRDARADISDIFHRFENLNRPRLLETLPLKSKLRRKLSRGAPTSLKRSARQVRVEYRKLIDVLRSPRKILHSSIVRYVVKRAGLKFFGSEDAWKLSKRAAEIEGLRVKLLQTGERTTSDIKNKLELISNELGRQKLARVQTFRELARLERKRGNDLISATYCLRIMRWLGRDALGDLDEVTATLKDNGFHSEAGAAAAMFDDPASAPVRCFSYLEEQYNRHLRKPDLPIEVLDDRRTSSSPRVSVIVSLYNAESKLSTLLRNLEIQSLNENRALEVVLVDSGSPTREYSVFDDYARSSGLSLVYVRSPSRETIQCAWNRGIKLARAPYLSFLGVDEGLHPDALALLAAHLDRDPDVDWIMADSVVTNVDQRGVFNGDVMSYRRDGYHQNLVYLETCYLSWVGGLYRKSIHDRFGFYDETFRAAGDTEFKKRVLPHIKTAHLPKLLGVFNNYPEERTTQHPRAEIEDLRAWYIHRTVGGLRYGFDRLPVATAEDLFRRSLSYRKSYCGHISTDFDMAAALGRYLKERGESGQLGLAAQRSADLLLASARAADRLDFILSPLERRIEVAKILASLARQESADMARFDLASRPHYKLLNDNRYEQHWWSWSA